MSNPLRVLIIRLLLLILPGTVCAELMLAKPYAGNVAISDYWISEKLDGIRARWDGQNLISKNGNRFSAPDWFTEAFPPLVMDGELWLGYEQYEKTSSIVRKKTPHNGWQRLRFMVFELPHYGSRFDDRVYAMRRLLKDSPSPYLGLVAQFRLDSEEELLAYLQKVVQKGGEGLMLHKADAIYQQGRSKDLLKLKLFSDAEATVLGYRQGKGKFAAMIGSLRVNFSDKIFYIGSGLNNKQRENPPPIGSTITFRHQGFTKNGIPRFPVFLRVRDEEPVSGKQ